LPFKCNLQRYAAGFRNVGATEYEGKYSDVNDLLDAHFLQSGGGGDAAEEGVVSPAGP
jgi:hypothetical protein